MSAALRMQEHSAGRELMFRGDYFSALATMQSALQSHGPHVGLLSDLVAVFSALGRIEDCEHMMMRLQSELELAQGSLQPDSIAKTKILLGKIYEEQADVARALKLYNEAVDVRNISYDVKIKAQSQLLRLQSFLGIKNGLSNLYRSVLLAKTADENIQTELEHALMLAEVVLFGMKLAGERVLAVKNRAYDRNLMIFDYAEECVRQNEVLVLARLQDQIETSEIDAFEQAVFNFIQSSSYTVAAKELKSLSGQISLMNIVRILELNNHRIMERDYAFENRRLMWTLLESVPTDSKNLLLKKWGEGAVVQQNLQLNVIAKKLFINEKSFEFKKDSFAEKCFSIFLTEDKVAIEDFVKAVFDSEYNLTHHDRTRVALTRLNKELATLTGASKLFHLSKTHVEIQNGFSIQKLS